MVNLGKRLPFQFGQVVVKQAAMKRATHILRSITQAGGAGAAAAQHGPAGHLTHCMASLRRVDTI